MLFLLANDCGWVTIHISVGHNATAQLRSYIMTDLLGNGYWFVMQEGQSLDEDLTDLLTLTTWIDDSETLILDDDCSFERIKSQFDFLRDQVHMMKGLYLYNRHPLLVKWIADYVDYNRLDCEVWCNIGTDCWYGVTK